MPDSSYITPMLPDIIHTEEELDDVMSRPSRELKEFIRTLPSPLVVLGASGKMGPSLAVRARRAAAETGHRLDVVAVARFSDPDARRWLEERGVTTVQCDLLDRSQVGRLPDAENVIYMAGRKFGTTDNPALTWGMNILPPEYVADRYRNARIVALSTGCVYPLVKLADGGSVESDELAPLGEYSNACVARERVFEYFSMRDAISMAMIRLNYAADLRYGVLADIASKVFRGEPVDLSMGFLNYIWQGDANDMILRSLPLCAIPPRPLNLTGREIRSVRDLALHFGRLLGREPLFTGHESDMALLSNPATAYELLGAPSVPHETVMRWTAAWIASGGRSLGKPTHYEQADGRY